jgi:hypothetical protein
MHFLFHRVQVDIIHSTYEFLPQLNLLYFSYFRGLIHIKNDDERELNLGHLQAW